MILMMITWGNYLRILSMRNTNIPIFRDFYLPSSLLRNGSWDVFLFFADTSIAVISSRSWITSILLSVVTVVIHVPIKVE